MKVHQIINNPIHSNSYIIEDEYNCAYIIDPGTTKNEKIVAHIHQNNLYVKAIFLTHEHIDHFAGANQLCYSFKLPVICSEACSENIRDSKKNLSKYLETYETYELDIPTISVSESQIKLANLTFTIIETPGHSPGSICLIVENFIFTGDTILNRIKTPLTLPLSNKKTYQESIEKLLLHLKPGMIIYPGHGESFTFSSIEDLCI